MPFYEYECQTCKSQFEKLLSFSKCDTIQDCPECQSKETKKIVSLTSFVLKGDGWPGKNLRIKAQMGEKNRRLDIKQDEQKRDAPVTTLAPNVGGQRVDSWSEAQKLATSQGKDGSTYEPMIRKEKAV